MSVLNKMGEQSCIQQKMGHGVLKDITPDFISVDLREQS